MQLARAVHHPVQGETTLLPPGVELTAPLIARLHEIGIYDLWVHAPTLDFLDRFFTPGLSTAKQRLCEALRLAFANQAQATTPKLPLGECRDAMATLVGQLLSGPRLPRAVAELAEGPDGLLRHSAEVCYLGMLLGLHLESYLVDQRKRLPDSAAREVVNLGLGCLLHDIGEMRLPEGVRESRRVEDDVQVEWQRHVELGHEMVRGQVDPSAATIVLNHHQHFDGSGFPRIKGGTGAAGGQIHVFTRIAMAADTFVHFLRDDVMPRPVVYALWKIQQRPYVYWFDPVILGTLLAIAPPFVPGTLVGLSDRRSAVVLKVNEKSPCRPVVQVLSGDDSVELTAPAAEVVDLAKEPSLEIQRVDGADVSKYLFGDVATPAAPDVGASSEALVEV